MALIYKKKTTEELGKAKQTEDKKTYFFLELVIFFLVFL